MNSLIAARRNSLLLWGTLEGGLLSYVLFRYRQARIRSGVMNPMPTLFKPTLPTRVFAMAH
ncbi:hypothetical protein HGRIS_008256 [Hohenbuehelia grisea]|uniref:Uncharacterized protein n=1 Tax=Hohenbuehelia grisea TaxID=104357 RepID=A0ABR3J7F3_9AGAR